MAFYVFKNSLDKERVNDRDLYEPQNALCFLILLDLCIEFKILYK